MNEQLQQALAEILQSAIRAKDFLVSEIPDVLHQLLVYKAVFSALSMTCFAALVGLIVWLNCKQVAFWRKKLADPYEDWGGHPEIMANLVQMFFVVPLTALWNTDWLMICLAPKVYLIEYAASLAK